MTGSTNEPREGTTSFIIIITFLALIIDKLFGMDAPSSIIFAPIVGRFIFMAYLSATKGD